MGEQAGRGAAVAARRLATRTTTTLNRDSLGVAVLLILTRVENNAAAATADCGGRMCVEQSGYIYYGAGGGKGRKEGRMDGWNERTNDRLNYYQRSQSVVVVES